MLKSILISWLTARALGEPRTLRQTARRSAKRKVSYYKPKAMARRSIRRTLNKLF